MATRLPLLALTLALGCARAAEQPALPSPVPAKPGSDWPAFLGPTGDSISTETGLLIPWPKNGPRVVWDCPVASGYAAPAISRGRLFLFDRLRDQARLRCLNSETGAENWVMQYTTDYEDKYGYSNGPRCYPITDGERVYTYGPDGMLHCVGAADGKVLWKVDTAKDFGVIQNFFGVGSTPVLEGELLIAQVGGSPKGSDEVAFMDLKGNGSGIVAFDKLTGKVRYQLTDELASYSVPVLATIDGRRWCFVFTRGGLVGFDPANGKVDFHFPWRAKTLESVNASSPVVVGNKVFVSETYGPGAALLEVRPGGYKVIWSDEKKGRDKSMQCHWNTPIHVDGYLYGCSGRHENGAELRCIELVTGKIMWSEPGLTRTSLLYADGHFICQSEEGPLLLLKVNPKKYEEISRIELKSAEQPLLKEPAWCAPILSHGLLYVRGRDRLVCLKALAQ